MQAHFEPAASAVVLPGHFAAALASTANEAVAALTQHATIHSASHDRMVISRYNVRNKQTNNEELKALVRAHGVLQNLIGYRQVVNGMPTGMIEIVGGGRRHTVVGELIADGDLPADYQLNYLLVTEAEAIEISLAENHGRADMHPADVFAAMQVLFEAGRALEDIALTFRLDVLEVRRRLKLAHVSPRLFALYRNDEADYRQMMALAISDDHAAQEQAWDALPEHHRSPHELRRLLTAQQVDIATDPVARYVGAAAYEKAGGVITRDLFSDHGTGYIGDLALLERLALAKMEKQRAKLLKEGQRWVDIVPRAAHAVLSSYGRVRITLSALDERQQCWLSAIEERIDALMARMEALDGEEDGAAEEEYGLLNAECDELVEQRRAIQSERSDVAHPDDAALAGAVILIDQSGELVVERNWIRPADRAKVVPTTTSTQTAQRRARGVHSDRLIHELTSHRTAALQAELMERGEVALAYLTYTLLRKLMPKFPSETLAKIGVAQPALANVARQGTAADAFTTRKHLLASMLPDGDSATEWLPWLLNQPQVVVLELLAWCVASTLDATQLREGDCPAFVTLAQALQLDMTKWWKPTADNYFNHVSKERMMAVLRQAVSNEAAVPLEKMKNPMAAAAAERALANLGWLPEPLRAT